MKQQVGHEKNQLCMVQTSETRGSRFGVDMACGQKWAFKRQIWKGSWVWAGDTVVRDERKVVRECRHGRLSEDCLPRPPPRAASLPPTTAQLALTDVRFKHVRWHRSGVADTEFSLTPKAQMV